MKMEKIYIDKIKPYENNAKLHPPEQIEQIKKSIMEFGGIMTRLQLMKTM